MKVALLTDGIWPVVIGGMQKHSYYLCKYLLANGVDVDLFYTSSQGREPHPVDDLFGAGCPGVFRSFYIHNVRSFYFPGHYLLERYLYSKRVSKMLADNSTGCDIIYAQGFSGWHLICNKQKLSETAPIILNFHGLNMFQRAGSAYSSVIAFFFGRIARKLLLKADFVQSLGPALSALLVQQGVRPARIFEMGNGIEEQWVRSAVQENPAPIRKFVFVGRFDPVKGISELYAALRMLDTKFQFLFYFVGAFPTGERLHRPSIIYLDTITDELLLKERLDDADVLVLPSHSEGMPTVILEAMARGCAIIATKVGAVPELVSAENGELIEPGSPGVLYNCLLRFLEMPGADLLKMKNASVSKISKRFLWQDVGVQMKERFSQMIQSVEHGAIV